MFGCTAWKGIVVVSTIRGVAAAAALTTPYACARLGTGGHTRERERRDADRGASCA